jgi:rubrerythrin
MKPIFSTTRRGPMAIAYTAEEIFQIGVEIERNGLRFYSAFAGSSTDKAVKKLCEELSAWEGQHVALFEGLKARLPEAARKEIVFDPQGELAAYLKAAADSHIFLASDFDALVARARTPLDVLSMALAFEKDSVVAYVSMTRLVPDHLGKAEIERIVDEELKHISIISAKMRELR